MPLNKNIFTGETLARVFDGTLEMNWSIEILTPYTRINVVQINPPLATLRENSMVVCYGGTLTVELSCCQPLSQHICFLFCPFGMKFEG